MTTHQKPSLFKKIRRTDEEGNEYWSAREILACTNHFVLLHDIVNIRSDAKNCGSSMTDHFENLCDRIELPEDLPTAESIKKLEGKDKVRQLKKSP